MKHAFTLIELLMVVAIIAIISTLAVNRVGGLRESAARRVSIANQKAVEHAVGAFITDGGRLNRLDSLISGQGDARTALRHGVVGFDCTHTNFTVDARELYFGPTRSKAGLSESQIGAFREASNAGLTPGLAGVLCLYTLTPPEASSLSGRLGLSYVMAHNEYVEAPSDAYKGQTCGDGTYVDPSVGVAANESGCLAIAVTNGMSLAAINPMTDAGRAIYRACGQELMKTEQSASSYTEAAVVAEVKATGGPLLAFGLGESASVVGKANAGLEAAPFAAYPVRKYYARYILLIRLRTAGSFILPEFAGVIDPCGCTVRKAQQVVDAL